ncbi:hypothetical protein [Gracilibacillus alcaliphilus]|uniref:hypothetical protein n=1 Tax=Gracilibacillus alcaliphilus TaxID=1401441 RepID=UPI00195B9E9A|nr:hypothetical protein [Gracilibacillus alcaliphilus]MBM7675382.1 hypothetical protein [Gracilibacillus alcaliphilus]
MARYGECSLVYDFFLIQKFLTEQFVNGNIRVLELKYLTKRQSISLAACIVAIYLHGFVYIVNKRTI